MDLRSGFLSGLLCAGVLIAGLSVHGARAQAEMTVNAITASETALPQNKIQGQSMVNAHHFSFDNIEGGKINLSDYKGRVILVVNTASFCGFTVQYADLQDLYNEYKDRGLVVIGVPSNNFGEQEPYDENEIKDFTTSQYGITFPITVKQDVKGENAHPFYEWAGAQKKGGLIFSKPRWNFHKYLIAPDGSLAGSFGSQVPPKSEKITQVIEGLL